MESANFIIKQNGVFGDKERHGKLKNVTSFRRKNLVPGGQTALIVMFIVRKSTLLTSVMALQITPVLLHSALVLQYYLICIR